MGTNINGGAQEDWMVQNLAKKLQKAFSVFGLFLRLKLGLDLAELRCCLAPFL